MRRAVTGIAIAAVAALLVAAVWGTAFGALLGAREVRMAPPVLGAIALFLLSRGPAALPAACGWALVGAAAAAAWRTAMAVNGANGWTPGEATPTWETAAEAAWLLALAVLAWRGVPARRCGPLVAAVVATTRIGGYGQALIPVLWEDTLRDAVLVSISVGAGLVAGVLVVVLAGWALSVLARVPERWAPSGRVLAGLAGLAALARMPSL